MNVRKFFAISLASLGLSSIYLGLLSLNNKAIAQNNNACASLYGNWAWDQRAFPAHLIPTNSGGTQGRIQATDNGTQITAEWECNNNTQMMTVYWSTGAIDTLSVSHFTLQGSNNFGSPLVIIRRADGDDRASSRGIIGGCPNSIIGNWAWDRRAFPASIFYNTVVANDGGKLITGSLRCIDSNSGRIEVNWSTGAVDILELSSDGQFLTGGNSPEYRFSVVRRIP